MGLELDRLGLCFESFRRATLFGKATGQGTRISKDASERMCEALPRARVLGDLSVGSLLAHVGFGSEETGGHILGSNHGQTPSMLLSLRVSACVLITVLFVPQSLVQCAGPPFLSCERPLRSLSLSFLALVSFSLSPLGDQEPGFPSLIPRQLVQGLFFLVFVHS